jgi:serine/threonine protein kinase
MGMTPFNDPDPQAASLKAQFRPPMPLPACVSAACADFVAQTLTKQAARRPTAAGLLGHPWVQAYMSQQDVQLYSREAAAPQSG